MAWFNQFWESPKPTELVGGLKLLSKQNNTHWDFPSQVLNMKKMIGTYRTPKQLKYVEIKIQNNPLRRFHCFFSAESSTCQALG
jgi:hypothetical protein